MTTVFTVLMLFFFAGYCGNSAVLLLDCLKTQFPQGGTFLVCFVAAMVVLSALMLLQLAARIAARQLPRVDLLLMGVFAMVTVLTGLCVVPVDMQLLRLYTLYLVLCNASMLLLVALLSRSLHQDNHDAEMELP